MGADTERKGITRARSPMQNGFIERFNSSFPHGVLDMQLMRSLSEVREPAELSLADNREIPP